MHGALAFIEAWGMQFYTEKKRSEVSTFAYLLATFVTNPKSRETDALSEQGDPYVTQLLLYGISNKHPLSIDK